MTAPQMRTAGMTDHWSSYIDMRAESFQHSFWGRAVSARIFEAKYLGN